MFPWCEVLRTAKHFPDSSVSTRSLYPQALPVETNEGGQLTERLAAHAQQAPVLDAWLATFPTLRQGLPAQQSLAEVATAVQGVAKRILASKAAAAAIKVCPISCQSVIVITWCWCSFRLAAWYLLVNCAWWSCSDRLQIKRR